MFLGPDSYGTFPEAVAKILPAASEATANKIISLYPNPSNSTPYTTETEQISKLIADLAFNCNRYTLSAAFPDSTYNVLFSIPPGTHGISPTFIFVDSPWPGSEQDLNPQVQKQIRRFIMNFVVSGNPNEADGQGVSKGVEWPVFGSKGMGLGVTGQDMTVVSAAGDKEVCDWWRLGLYLT